MLWFRKTISYYYAMYFGTKPYGLEGYIRNYGDGSNMYRGEDFGQPNTLHNGDVLANGWTVVEKPFQRGNGIVGLLFNNGEHRLVPARIPLQLKSDKPGVLPAELATGHILQTGSIILDEPRYMGATEWHKDQHEVAIKLTDGWEGRGITVPDDLAIAVFDEMYPPSSVTLLGAFVLGRALDMPEVERQNLPNLGNLR